MRLTQDDAEAYSVLLYRLHHKFFTKQFDGADCCREGDGSFISVNCTHDGEDYTMTRLDEVVRHIQAFGV